MTTWLNTQTMPPGVMVDTSNAPTAPAPTTPPALPPPTDVFGPIESVGFTTSSDPTDPW